MIPALLAILALVILGMAIARALDAACSGLRLAGLSFLYGSGAASFVLLALATLHVPWGAGTVAIAMIAVFAIAAGIAWRNASPRSVLLASRPHVVDLLTLATVAGYAVYATMHPPWEWDFWAIWGLKGRVFLEAGGLDWGFLESPWNLFAHPDYPALVPLDFDVVALVSGGWDDRWMGMLEVAWGASLLLIVREQAARETTPLLAAVAAFAVAAPALTRFVGLAEGALVAFGAAGVLLAREAMRDEDAAAWRHAAFMLGFAANCKNEGIALLAAVMLAIALTGPRSRIAPRLARLWPAYALVVPWILIRAMHALPTDLAGGDAASRLAERLPQAGAILALLAAKLHRPWFWAALVAAMLVVPPAAIVRERFVIVVTIIQLAFFAGAYLVTPYDIGWHVFTSWPRLTAQLAVPIAFVVALMLAGVVSAPGERPRSAPTA